MDNSNSNNNNNSSNNNNNNNNTGSKNKSRPNKFKPRKFIPKSNNTNSNSDNPNASTTTTTTVNSQPHSTLSPFAPVFVPGTMGAPPPPLSLSESVSTSSVSPTANSTQPRPRDNKRGNRNNNNNNNNQPPQEQGAQNEKKPKQPRNNRSQRNKDKQPNPSVDEQQLFTTSATTTPTASDSSSITTSTTTTTSSATVPESTSPIPKRNDPQSKRNNNRGPRSDKNPNRDHPHPHSHPHPPPANNNRPNNKYKYVSSANTNNSLKKQGRGMNADDISTSIGDHTMLASKIIVKLNQNTYECMVCYDTVSRKSDVWWCSFCYALFHLKCIDEWSSRSYNEGAKLGWRCPGCQHVNSNAPECVCFCSKTRCPDFNPYFIPHSCGENCGKARGVDCPHPCPLLCHPGPCPPCTIAGKEKQCFCGKEHYRLKCGETDKGMTCGSVCDKPLKCGKHKCKLDCHPGPCSTCQVIEEQKCYCGSSTQKKLCGTGTKDLSQGEERVYSCGSICNRNLACGKHQCKSACHPGECAECELLPKNVSTCPCGTTPISVTRKSCTDPIPTCTNTCNKLLACGKHSCPQQCHTGPCAPCEERVLVRCRCRTMSAALICNEVCSAPPDAFQCNSICKKQKSCGQHTCGVKCCPSMGDPSDPTGNHVCIQLCDKPLKCGEHNCPQLCHKGRCRRCTHVSFDELACACGKTVIFPPVVCGTPIPKCPHPCTRERPCGHVSSIPHECHPGDCPPCVALVERMCMGGHMLRRNVRCSQNEVSCGFPCGKKLQCGNHVCTRICHNGPCFEELHAKKKKNKGKAKQAKIEAAEALKAENKEKGEVDGFGDDEPEPLPTCGRLCLAKLSTCEHLCQSICHPGKPCPVTVCKQLTKVRCVCGRKSGESVCNHSGDGIPTGNEAKPLPCDDACEVEIRNRKLAEALGITSSHGKAPQYSELLINLAKASPMFVKKIEQNFEELLNSPPSTKLNLPVMDRVKRQLVHELSKHYNLETQSIDKEPARSIVVTRTRDSKLPAVILSDCIAPRVQASQPSSLAQRRLGPATLHIYNLQSYVKTNHLVAFLQAYNGQYRLQWVDDANCLVIFNDELTMRAALSDLSGGMFCIKMYKDLENPQEALSTPQVLASLPVKEKRVLTAKVVQDQEESWRRNDNAFAALGGIDHDEPSKSVLSSTPPSSSSTTTTTTTTTASTTNSNAESVPPTSWEDEWKDEDDNKSNNNNSNNNNNNNDVTPTITATTITSTVPTDDNTTTTTTTTATTPSVDVDVDVDVVQSPVSGASEPVASL